jgi:O-acetyl-ADP-ribose deacetylase (regulator of RNase III)
MSIDEMLNVLLSALSTESGAVANETIPRETAGKWHLLRALINIRPPIALSPELLELQDRLLSVQREAKGVSRLKDLPSIRREFPGTRIPLAERLVLWRGDITTLDVDAIVNAANDRLLGCFIPHHRCIDNAIHSAAGIQLRLECNEIMRAQGHAEPTGQAKITRGYNLPARYVLHTVGPIITVEATEEDKRLLASCYTSCLNLAAQYSDIRSVAFCCISTGEYRFPREQAAEIAVQTVCEWLKRFDGCLEKVIFNVFSQEDIPHCPNCGDYLERNLRRDNHFVAAPYMGKHGDYADFINRSTGGKLVLLELGVGFNTPSIIRWPFERITAQHPHATLIRINLDDAHVPGQIAAKSIQYQEDIAKVMQALVD